MRVHRVIFAAFVVASACCHAEAGSRKPLRGDKFAPTWSKDGKFISFSLESSPGNFEIRLATPDGRRVRAFFFPTGVISDSRAPGKILFSSQGSPPDDNEIYSANLDGTGLKQLTDNSMIDGGPGWSSTRSRVAFVTNRDGQWELYVMNADGSGQTNLSNTPNAREGAAPASWSPDDHWILFHSNMDGDDEIYQIHPDGTGLRQITDNEVRDFNPSFSPDGKYIAFISNRKGTTTERDNRIFIMNADGSNQRQVGDANPIHGSLSWSPRGDELAFNAYSDYTVEIFVIRADGAQLRQVTVSPPQPLLETLKRDGAKKAYDLDVEHKKKGALGLFAFAAMQRFGNEAFSQQELEKAVAAFTFLTERYPARADYWSSLGEAQKGSGDKQNAIRSLKRSLSLDPSHVAIEKLLKEMGAGPMDDTQTL